MKTDRRSLLAGITGTFVSTAGCLSLDGPNSDVGTVRCSEELSREPAADGRLPASTHDWPASHYDQRRSAITPVSDVPRECAQLQWSFEAPAGPVRSSEDETSNGTDGIEYGGVTVADGTVFFPTYAAVYALDLQTGERLWKASLPEDGWTPVTATTETVYIGLNGGILALEAGTGDRRWLRRLRGGSDKGYSPDLIKSAPTIGEQHVFVGNTGGRLFAIDRASGTIEWTFDAKRRDPSKEYDPDNANDFGPASAYSDGVLYTGSENARVYAHDAATGEVLWTNVPDHPPSTCHRIRSAPTVTPDAIYITASCAVRVIDRADGSELRTYSGDPGSARVSPIVTDGTMYVASGDHYESLGMTAIDLETRSEQWKVPGRPISDASYAAGMLYTGISDELVAIDADSGEVSWTVSLKSVASDAPPAITDGAVIVGDRDGVAYGIGRP